MIMFSPTFLHVLITLALIWTALGGLVLLGLLIRDYCKSKLW